MYCMLVGIDLGVFRLGVEITKPRMCPAMKKLIGNANCS